MIAVWGDPITILPGAVTDLFRGGRHPQPGCEAELQVWSQNAERTPRRLAETFAASFGSGEKRQRTRNPKTVPPRNIQFFRTILHNLTATTGAEACNRVKTSSRE
jgi:hypothetical protein